MDQLGNMFNKYAAGNQAQTPGQNYPQQAQSSAGNQNTGQGLGDSISGFMNNFGGQQQQAAAHANQGVQQGNSVGVGGGGSGGGGFLGGLQDRLQGAAGGGRESEKNEDYLDKGVDFVQERFLGQGPQDNESAVEQLKDEQISDFIRSKYKSTTGTDFPIKDKQNQFDKFGGGGSGSSGN